MKHSRTPGSDQSCGMVCRFGSEQDARPVTVPLALYEGWILPPRSANRSIGRKYVFAAFMHLRHSRILPTRSSTSLRLRRLSASTDGLPFGVRFGGFKRQDVYSRSTSCGVE